MNIVFYLLVFVFAGLIWVASVSDFFHIGKFINRKVKEIKETIEKKED